MPSTPAQEPSEKSEKVTRDDGPDWKRRKDEVPDTSEKEPYGKKS